MQLCQLYRRFGYLSIKQLAIVLKQLGYNINRQVLEKLTQYCHQCQLHGKAPGRYKFTLKDDHEFNYSIIVDVLYLNGKPVLQIVDSATAFQAARFLTDIKTTTAWLTILDYWISIYLGPLDIIVINAGKNFIGIDFK